MPVGITGRRADMAFARSNTWGVPASVTQQILIDSNEGFDNMPEIVEDESFPQDYIAASEIGDMKPIVPELSMQMRFEQGCDVLIAASMGSAAAPTTVSSQAAGSLVACSHVVTMAPDLAHFFTFATDMVQYVQELRTAKVAGFTIKVGPNGRMLISFPLVGDKSTYDSTTNINSTVGGAVIATPGNRAFRKSVRVRMNLQSAIALAAADEQTLVKEFTITQKRPLAQDDHVVNSDVIIEPDDDGFFEGEIEVGFARMNTVTSNSLAIAYQAGTVFKADYFFQGTYINSTTRRSMLFEFPALQVAQDGYKAVVSGHGEIRPTCKFRMRLADAAPLGMTALTSPMRVTIVNSRLSNLLA